MTTSRAAPAGARAWIRQLVPRIPPFGHRPEPGAATPTGAARRHGARVPIEAICRLAVAVLWVSLLLTAGPALAAALDVRERPVQVVASCGLWTAWAIALVAALVPRTLSLTIVRVVMPAAVPVLGWAAVATATGGARADAVAAVGTAVAVTVLVLSAVVGDGFVNGSSYGDERRFPLRPPAALVAGPVPIAWVVCVAGTVTGPLLLAAGRWIEGAPATLLGGAAAFLGARALHGLSRRWLVFVPAGLVVHDPLTLAEPVMCTRRTIRHVGPAPATTPSLDLTGRVSGTIVWIALSDEVEVTRRQRPRKPAAIEAVATDSLLVAPSRPGAVLRAARRRRLPVLGAAGDPAGAGP